MNVETQMVPVRDGIFNIEVQSAGHGEPLVFLHGGTGATWRPFLDDLTQDFSVYQPSHPGFGASTGLEYLDDVVDMAVFYLDLFDALGLQSVNLLGSSLGGMFGAEIAALGGSYVRKLVLQAPVGLWRDDAMPPDLFTMTPDEIARATYFDAEASQARLPQPDPNDKQAMARATIERQKALQTTGKFIWPIWDKGLKKRIHRIKAPTLLVWGEADGLVPPVYGEEFKGRIPGSRLVVIPQAGHVPMFEQREAFVSLVREFFQS
jgi:pimeloyl-ACP methyl ester carboxylesterase